MKPSILKFALLVGILLSSFATPTLASAAGPLSWTVTHMDGIDLNAVSCPSESLCVAVGNGNVMTSTNPAGGPNTWTVTHTEKYYLDAVSCPSESLCVAVGAKGDIVTSTNPTGGASAWTVTHAAHLGTLRLATVSCPSVSLCVAGGAVYVKDLINDSEEVKELEEYEEFPGNFGGVVVTSTNPTGGTKAWTVSSSIVNYEISAVSCPSKLLCVGGGGNELDIVTSTNPTGGAGTWTDDALAPGEEQSVYGASCPSESLCVMADSFGTAISTNPTGGASAWAEGILLEEHSERATTVSCPSESLCVALDGFFDVYTATDPANAPNTWIGTELISPEEELFSETEQEEEEFEAEGKEYEDEGREAYEAGSAEGASCPSGSLCVIVVPRGYLMIGTSTPPPKEEIAKPGGSIESEAPLGPLVPRKKVSCTVPKLKGKALPQAKRLLTQHHCKLEKVKKTKKHDSHKVVGQTPAAGKKLPAGTKVSIRLG